MANDMQPTFSLPTPQEIDALIKEALAQRHQDARRARSLALQAREKALEIDYQKGLAYSLYVDSLCHFILVDEVGEGVLEEAMRARSLMRGLNDEHGEATALNLIATIYYRQNEYTQALEHYQRSLQIRRKIGDRAGESGSLNNISLVYYDLALYADALEHLFQSLEIAEAIQDPDSAAYALSNIAQVYAQTGEHEKALEYYQRGLEYNQQTNDRALEASTLAQIGRSYAELGDNATAIRYLERSLELSRLVGNMHDEGTALISLGFAYLGCGHHDDADTALAEALEIMRKVGDRYSEVEALNALGSNSLKRGDGEGAMLYILQGMIIAEEIQSEQLVNNAQQLLAEAYAKLGRFDKALEYYRLYHKGWQTIFGRSNERRIQALVMRAEVEKAQREVEDQRLKNFELSQAMQALQIAHDQNAELVRQLKLQAEMLEQLAREDGLTGLANRRWLDVQLAQEFERARRFGHPLAVAILDIDHFKSVNDRFSHQAGDEVLRAFAALLRSHCRSVDTVGRFGGEEFLLILVETPRIPALALCERLRCEVEQKDWTFVHPDLLNLTISIGLSDNEGASTPQQIVAWADQKLYQAKHRGRNQVCASLDE